MCGCGTDGILCLMQLSSHQLLIEKSNFVFINYSFPAYHLLLIFKLCRISGWVGMLHHVQNVHELALSFSKMGPSACSHGELTDDRDKAWIENGSPAHSARTKIVLDKWF